MTISRSSFSNKLINDSLERSVNIIQDLDTASDWVRNSEWLAMPSVTTSDEKICILFGIWNSDNNVMTFRVSGNYTVDWGDGTGTQNVSSGVDAVRIFDYGVYDPTNTTLTSDGYKQVLVTITPQGGASITSFQLHVTSAYGSSRNALDIVMAVPNITNPTNLIFSINADTSYSSIERISIVKHGFPANSSLVNNNYSGSPRGLFSNLQRLKHVEMDLSNVTNVQALFYNCGALEKVPPLNYSNVITGTFLFYNCNSLKQFPSLKFTNLQTANNMFIYCYNLRNVDLIEAPNVNNLANAFQSCYSLQNISNLNTTKANNITGIFYDCYSLKNAPYFETSNVSSFLGSFNNCFSLSKVPKYSIRGNVNFSSAFSGCYNLQDLSHLNFGKVSGAASMFNLCYRLQKLPTLDLSNVTSLNSTFKDCASLTDMPLINIPNCTDIQSAFYSCLALKSLNFANTNLVTNMTRTFHRAATLSNISNLNTSNVSTLTFALAGTSGLNKFVLDTVNGIPVTLTSLHSSDGGFVFNPGSNPAFNFTTTTGNIKANIRVGATFPLLGLTPPVFDQRYETSNIGITGSLTSRSRKVIFLSSRNLDPSTGPTSFYGGNPSASNIIFQDLSLRGGALTIGNKLSANGLTRAFTSLGRSVVGNSTLTISSNWGAEPEVVRNANMIAGSSILTMSNTANIIVGMEIRGNGISTFRDIVIDSTSNTIIIPSHGISNNTIVSFANTVVGIIAYSPYNVINSTTDTFQLSNVYWGNGSIQTFSANANANIYYYPTVLAVNNNSNVTISIPAFLTANIVVTGSGNLKRSIAKLKGWVVSG
jgi:hypothetical protein